MFKFALLGTFLALGTCQPLNQEDGPYADYNPFGQNHEIVLRNDQEQTLGYLYSITSQAVKQQKQNLFPVKDSEAYIFGYYSLNQFKEGQELVLQQPDEKVVSQLSAFGVIYRPSKKGVRGAFVFPNPNALEDSVDGVLTLSSLVSDRHISGSKFPHFYGQQYPQQYGFNYDQEYQYQEPYSQQFQGPYAYQYQGPYAYQYQGPYAYQYQGPYTYQYQRPYTYQYQRPYGYYGYQYLGPYNYQRRQGPFYRYPFNYDQYAPAY